MAARISLLTVSENPVPILEFLTQAEEAGRSSTRIERGPDEPTPHRYSKRSVDDTVDYLVMH